MMITHTLRTVRLRTNSVRSYNRYLTTIGIRREDPARVWERRAPLTPEAVQSLLSSKNDLAVEVESCERRCFPNRRFQEVSPCSSGIGHLADQQAGAKIVDELSGSTDLVIGIKEAPVREVQNLLGKEQRKRTWMMFSHTHKGQVCLR